MREEIGCTETGAALCLALATAPDPWISYSRHVPHYSRRPARYRDRLYTYRRVVPAVDRLAALGLIDHHKTAPGVRGWQSTMRATPELVRCVGSVLRHTPPLRIATPRETVVLRNANREDIDYSDDQVTRRMRRSLDEYNEAIRATEISENAGAPLVRIFNGNWDRGGRFYAKGGGWQTMPKEARRQISIGGEPVVELDYKTLHPAILYAQAGTPLPADCYKVGNWPRPLVKVALLILINTRSKNQARLTIAHEPAMESEAKPGSQEALNLAAKLMADLYRCHAPIADAFHRDVGANLMAIDSALAEVVMHQMLREGIVVLPIHDSFLVPASKAARLEAAMLKAAHRAGIRGMEVREA